MSRSPHPSPSLRPFRVWDRERHLMIKWADLAWLQVKVTLPDEILNGEVKDTWLPVLTVALLDEHGHKLVCEQDTGVKDHHGVAIYQGDILRFDIKGITHGPEREEGIIGEVWYCVEDAGWAIGHWKQPYIPRSDSTLHEGETRLDRIVISPLESYDWWYSFEDRIDMSTIEVIGNVHENPQLLT